MQLFKLTGLMVSATMLFYRTAHAQSKICDICASSCTEDPKGVARECVENCNKSWNCTGVIPDDEATFSVALPTIASTKVEQKGATSSSARITSVSTEGIGNNTVSSVPMRTITTAVVVRTTTVVRESSSQSLTTTRSSSAQIPSATLDINSRSTGNYERRDIPAMSIAMFALFIVFAL
jgi:hypothetical protein